MIAVWLRGGCSHLDTYDPKPDARSEFRGPFATIETKTPGLRFTELIPHQAAISDRFTVLRSLAHTGAATRPASAANAQRRPRRPGQAGAEIPRLHVGRPLPAGRTPAEHFRTISGSTRSPGTTASNCRPGLSWRVVRAVRVAGRSQCTQLPGAERGPGPLRRRPTDSGAGSSSAIRSTTSAATSTHSGTVDAIDRFEAQALDLLTSPEAARAFDLTREDPKRPRAVRPEPVGPAVPDGPPAGRGGVEIGDHHVRRPALRPGGRTGTTTR